MAPATTFYLPATADLTERLLGASRTVNSPLAMMLGECVTDQLSRLERHLGSARVDGEAMSAATDEQSGLALAIVLDSDVADRVVKAAACVGKSPKDLLTGFLNEHLDLVWC